jgi:hypothetical protein
MNARDRLGSARGFVRPDGLPIADTVADLLDTHRVWYAANLTETGVPTTQMFAQIWTGSTADGMAASATCGDWIKNTTTVFGNVGFAESGPAFSHALQSDSCSGKLPLYCVEVDHTDPLPAPPPVPGKLAFLSSGTFTPSMGLAAANALCDGEKPASATGTVVALLATSSRSAKSLLTGAAYVRPDGIPINSIRGFVLGGMTFGTFGTKIEPSGIWQHGDGSYALPEGGGRDLVWNGAAVFDGMPQAPGHTCGDWSLATGFGDVGRASAGAEAWGNTMGPCDAPLPVYCIEQ